MKRLLAGALLMALGVSAQAAQTQDASQTRPYEAVRSVFVPGGFQSFEALDNHTLILWASPFRPYLVELGFPSHDLRFAQAIAVQSTFGSQIYSKFDSVHIGGFRYPIDQIYKLSPQEARRLRAES